jgi:hypothetical protein
MRKDVSEIKAERIKRSAGRHTGNSPVTKARAFVGSKWAVDSQLPNHSQSQAKRDKE